MIAYLSVEQVLALHARLVAVFGGSGGLRERGGAWAVELAPGRAYRVAVDQQMASAGTRLREGAEVAVFPPVTGG